MRKVLFLCSALFAIISCSDSGSSDSYVFKGNPPVMFSEIYTANVSYKDEFGDKPGWVEFYNPADTAVNISGYSLTNNANEILWTFGDAAVLPHSYLTVFFSGRNKPDLIPPSNNVDLLGNAVGAWDWADSQNDPPGKSTAQFNFSKNTGISGTLKTENNSPALEWSSATIMLKLKGWNNKDAIDISETSQILLRGYLGKNQKLEIRFPYEGIDDWAAWPAIIKGTGEQNDLYAIELPLNTEDFKNIYGLRFGNVPNNYGTINFSFNSIIARKRSDIHVSFELNKNGGKLYLMDSQRQVRDSVVYPGETKDLSFAKNFENGQWALSRPPTPNAANSSEFYTGQAQMPSAIGIPNSGYFSNGLSFTLPTGTDGIIHCDTSGAAPNENSALKSGSVLSLAKTAVLRCAQFKAGTYPSEPILRTYIIGERLPSLPVVSIAVDPKDMFDKTIGLYEKGPNASAVHPYFGANFWEDTELPIQVDFFESRANHAWSYPAGIEIFGNYSRGNPKKSVAIGFKGKYGQKKLNYPLFPEHTNLKKFNWFILRNNGNNFGRDYIRDMLMSSLTEGLDIDYQKGRAVIVYYNGEYFGIHNLQERSNKDYFETNYGLYENSLDLVKGNNEVSQGSDADYQSILRWLGSTTLNNESLKQLEKQIDLDNYTNYMQSEIYFANKDWPGNNLKRWRSNSPISKWKWLIYDTDFGFGGENSQPNVKMLNFVTDPNGPDWPNPPHSTLLIRKLLENQNYKNAFINRFSLLLATYYAPARVEQRINVLMNAIESEIPLDQQRWKLNASTMNGELTKIRNFGKSRQSQMQGEIEEFFGLKNPVDFAISSKGSGKVLVHNLPVLNGKATFKAYPAIPITIKAVPSGGAKFNGWSDGVMAAERTIWAGQAVGLEAIF
ncbi:MAG: CotH kinase family protein [Fibromonadaceae bacterium]|jgi:hypothetical protein|nr:CotH kinase family protein [Fibromonadaceae bacterium]